MAVLTVQQISLAGLEPAFVAADAEGDEFVNSGRVFLHVKNGDALAATVTIDSQAPCNYGFDHNVEVSVPAGEERLIGPFKRNRFNNSEGKVQVAYSSVSNLTVAAVELP